ncbi:MAG: MFS transporter [Deltaproteobacteria bacterium]|nr:MFS transporter [Deltaproteobacteria bacterium]
MKQQTGADVKMLFALTLIHFIGDFYSSFITPLLPVFIEKFSLTLTQVGLITGISRLLAFIVQPPVGYIADHYRTRIFILGGPLLSILFIPLVGIAPFFLVLILFISLGSIGSSMFHPTCAGMVSTYAGRHFGLSMSIFNMGGTLAFGVGPLFITYFVYSFGLRSTPFTMVIGLAVMVLLFRIVPLPEGEGLTNLGFFSTIKEILGPVWKPISVIWLVMVLRSFAGQSFFTFVPVLLAKEGYSLISVGSMISIFTVAGAISGLLAGHLSDRVGYKPIFFVTHSLATPSLYLLIFLPGNWVYFSAFLTGFFILATLPLGVAMAQELAPRGKSLVSSLMMGLAFGTGGMMTPLTGKLADIFSIRPVLAFLAIIPLLTTGLIALLPGKKMKYGFKTG